MYTGSHCHKFTTVSFAARILRAGVFAFSTAALAASLTSAVLRSRLALAFPEFAPYLGRCRFDDCAHVREQGCAVLEALEAGKIHPSRHGSYVRLYETIKEQKPWDMKK